MNVSVRIGRTSQAVSTFLTVMALAIVGVLLVATGAQAAGTAKVIKLISVKVSEKHSTENTFVIKENDFINGKKVGHDTLVCKVVSQAKAQCTVVFALTSGTIKAKFTTALSASGGRGTITGGPGEYATAKGRLVYRNLNEDGSRTAVTLTLT